MIEVIAAPTSPPDSLSIPEESTPVVIRVENVSKRYTLNDYRPSLRHDLKHIFARALRRVKIDPAQPAMETRFYALKDVSFSVRKGEAVGVIGRNGSGKTTLLRLLSGITRPTTGRVSIDGRFAALIALSAGFNAEMTGRKNIYLNAAIQGVPPPEVKPIEDAIIDFAEIGAFIDQPVKLYSSGMIARLGFSIAIHILPDIVFLDEVLAVGDEGFAAKCHQRIMGLHDEGRTLVMVTHDPDAVRKLCTRAIWINKGVLMQDGEPDGVLKAYSESFRAV
ncbi:MAG: ABC transporter ATP-binding protein [Chloroflexota bacterium]|nr:ABC transporter ATP-binding protein [Chloroflexota bacterium]